MTEDQLLRNILQLAGYLHVATAHFRPARTERGWRTPVQGDGKGFPDLVLVRNRVLYREVKSTTGRLEPAQIRWRDVLLAAGQDWAVWRPEDWTSGRIEHELKALHAGAQLTDLSGGTYA